MKRALSLTALIFGLALALPHPSAACYDTCAVGPGDCRTCETGFDVTFEVCIQTSECQCITYFVPSYQCIGLTAGGTAPSVAVPELGVEETPAQPALDLSFLAPAP